MRGWPRRHRTHSVRRSPRFGGNLAGRSTRVSGTSIFCEAPQRPVGPRPKRTLYHRSTRVTGMHRDLVGPSLVFSPPYWMAIAPSVGSPTRVDWASRPQGRHGERGLPPGPSPISSPHPTRHEGAVTLPGEARRNVNTLGAVITVTGCLVLLAGIVALYRSLRNDDDVRRAGAFSVAVGIMSMGVLAGAVGIGAGTGEFPSGRSRRGDRPRRCRCCVALQRP